MRTRRLRSACTTGARTYSDSTCPAPATIQDRLRSAEQKVSHSSSCRLQALFVDPFAEGLFKLAVRVNDSWNSATVERGIPHDRNSPVDHREPIAHGSRYFLHSMFTHYSICKDERAPGRGGAIQSIIERDKISYKKNCNGKE